MEKNIKSIEELVLGSPKQAENFYLQIELEDQGQDFIKLQLDKEGNVVGATPFFSQFCQGLKIELDTVQFNWPPDIIRGKKGTLKYKVIDYEFLLPKHNEVQYNGESAFIGSLERFEDVGIAEDCKQNLDIHNETEVKDFCRTEAEAWYNGFEDDSPENRQLFAKILYNKLLEKHKK